MLVRESKESNKQTGSWSDVYFHRAPLAASISAGLGKAGGQRQKKDISQKVTAVRQGKCDGSGEKWSNFR